MLLEIEEERRLHAAAKADLGLLRRIKSLLSEDQNASMILSELAESCTTGENEGGVAVVFALIGEKKRSLTAADALFGSREEQLIIRAQSGEPAGAHGVNGGPRETLWRQAVEQRRVTGAEAERLPLARGTFRALWPFHWKGAGKSRGSCWPDCRDARQTWRCWSGWNCGPC